MPTYRVISADSHVAEPPELWLNYIDPRFRERAPRIVSKPDTDEFQLEGVPTWPMGLICPAGKPKHEIRAKARFHDAVRPGAWEPQARLKDMEQDGVDAEVIYPTLAMRLFGLEDLDFLYACMEAYNNWMADFCRVAPARLKAPGLISLEDIDRGVQELRRVIGMGLAGGMIAIDPGHPEGYTHRKYDRFWEVAQELDVPISMHILTDRARVIGSTAANAFADQGTVKLKPSVGESVIPIQRSLQELILSGVFERFPRLRVVSVENGAGWAVHFLERLDEIATGEAPLATDTGLSGDMLPSEIFHRNVFLTFIRDKNGVRCRDVVGTDNMMWSSDFPHAASTWPNSRQVIERHFVGVPEQDRQKIVAGNAMRLYGFGNG